MSGIARSFFPRFLVAFVLACAVAAGAGTASHAQNSETATIVQQQQPVISSLVDRVNALEQQVTANAENDARLVDLRLELEALARDFLNAGVAFRPRLTEINTRLEQLGPVPASGEPAEPDVITRERQELAGEKASINVLIGEAETASLRVNRLIDRIAEMRRDLFANTLSKRYEINYALFGEVVTAFNSQIADLYRQVSSWMRFVVNFKLRPALAAAFFAVAAAAVLLIGGRRLFGRLFIPDATEPDPPYISRLSVAFWSTLLVSAAVGLFLFLVWFFFSYFNVLRGDIGGMLAALFVVLSLVQFVNRLANAVLSPRLPNWRLVEIAPRPGRLLVWLITATAFVAGLDFLFSRIFDIVRAPLSLTVGESLAATVVVGLLVMLIATVRPFVDEEGRPRHWPIWLRSVLYVLGAATIIAALLGYVGLAKFMSQQIVVTGAILVTMYIGFLSARAISDEGAFAGTAIGRALTRRFKPDEAALDQMGLVTSILINLLVVLFGVPLILLQWGFQLGDIRAFVYGIAQEIRIGTVSFSLIGIMSGILVFALGMFATRWFQSWLDGSVMARGRVDAGVRNSIRTAVGYAGIALAGVIGISAAGINLSSLALVAGALSLGIGFGLQNVVSNFVSGLILLAERPFKVGDWIVAGAVQGTVRKISVRATEIETFQRQTVIMPNSELINAAVGNWTHKNKLGRVDIPVGVAYGSDVRKVHAILIDIVKNHPLVLKNPEPFVLFGAFGESSLDFEIRLFLSDITNGVRVQNDIRFTIIETFEREGIDIPFPHRKLLIDRDLLTPLAAPTVDADRAPAEPPPPRRRRGRKPDPG